jgi:phage terminase large subunit
VITLPHNWYTRSYQDAAWRHMVTGGMADKRADLCWHRRCGKDELCLHLTSTGAFERVGNYWHMLPEAEQARKAIWEAVNPHTGKRRIDEAFPREIRRRTVDHRMMIEFVNGSIWNVVGSDNFNSLVGSPPIGVTISEWALANPLAWGYLRPILRENHGWALRIYTPRGKNHAYRGHQTALQSMRTDGRWFAQKLSAYDTGVFTAEQLAEELSELQGEYGENEGLALFEQEYGCSFEAAILGAIYASWMNKAEVEGRIRVVLPDPDLAVNTAWDLGYDDLTAIWWWQVVGNELRVLDYYQNNGKDIDHYAEQVWSRPYNYSGGKHYGPHDAANKLLAARGRSIVDQLYENGIVMETLPAQNINNSIQAARRVLPNAYFDREKTEEGREALSHYHYPWDKDRRIMGSEPVHDWSSHACDAFEIIAQVWQPQKPIEQPKNVIPDVRRMTINQMIAARTKARRAGQFGMRQQRSRWGRPRRTVWRMAA